LRAFFAIVVGDGRETGNAVDPRNGWTRNINVL